jgi:uncharacterized membrane protein
MKSQTLRGILSSDTKKGGAKQAMSDSLKVILGILVGGIVVLLFVSTLGGGGMMGGMGSMMGGGLFGMLFALLFWVALVTLLIALVLWIINQAQQRR